MIIRCHVCGREFDKASRRNQHVKDAHNAKELTMESTNTPAIKATAPTDEQIIARFEVAISEYPEAYSRPGECVYQITRNEVLAYTRAALATPAIQAVSPILTEDRASFEAAKRALVLAETGVNLVSLKKNSDGTYEAEHFEQQFKGWKLACAALAAVPAQQPPTFKLRDQCGGKIIDYAYRRDHHSQRQCEVCGWRAPRELQSLTVCPNDKAAPAAPVAPDLASLKRYACFEQEDGIYESQWGNYVLFVDVERLLSHSTQAPGEPNLIANEINGWLSAPVEPVSEDKKGGAA